MWGLLNDVRCISRNYAFYSAGQRLCKKDSGLERHRSTFHLKYTENVYRCQYLILKIVWTVYSLEYGLHRLGVGSTEAIFMFY